MKNYRPMRILISGGGTGGHIFPAVSIADEMRRLNPDSEILFVGAEGKMEMEKVPAAGYRIVGLPVVGLQRQLNLKNIMNDLQAPFKIVRSISKAGKIIKDFRPDVAVGVGGYASAPSLVSPETRRADIDSGAERIRGTDEQDSGTQCRQNLRGLQRNGKVLSGGQDSDDRKSHKRRNAARHAPGQGGRSCILWT